MGQPKKQSPAEMKAAMNEIADSNWCDNILSELEGIFDSEDLSYDERILRIDRRKSAYRALEATINGEYTKSFTRNDNTIFLSLKSLKKIIAVCDMCTEELERLKSIPKESALVVFQDYLNVKPDQKDDLMETLHTLRKNGKGRTLAIMILALEETGLLLPYKSLRELFKYMEVVFDNPGRLTGFQDQYRIIKNDKKDKKTLSIIDQYRKQLKPFYSHLI